MVPTNLQSFSKLLRAKVRKWISLSSEYQISVPLSLLVLVFIVLKKLCWTYGIKTDTSCQLCWIDTKILIQLIRCCKLLWTINIFKKRRFVQVSNYMIFNSCTPHPKEKGSSFRYAFISWRVYVKNNAAFKPKKLEICVNKGPHQRVFIFLKCMAFDRDVDLHSTVTGTYQRINIE